jgi:hypothetical protein
LWFCFGSEKKVRARRFAQDFPPSAWKHLGPLLSKNRLSAEVQLKAVTAGRETF